MARVLMFVIPLAIMVYALVDCVRTPEQAAPSGVPKPVWIAVIVLVPVLGALGWLAVSRIPGINLPRASGGSRPRPPRGPVAPDDDPEFLANLDWQARKAYYERQRRQAQEHPDDPDDDASPTA